MDYKKAFELIKRVLTQELFRDYVSELVLFSDDPRFSFFCKERFEPSWQKFYRRRRDLTRAFPLIHIEKKGIRLRPGFEYEEWKLRYIDKMADIILNYSFDGQSPEPAEQRKCPQAIIDDVCDLLGNPFCAIVASEELRLLYEQVAEDPKFYRDLVLSKLNDREQRDEAVLYLSLLIITGMHLRSERMFFVARTESYHVRVFSDEFAQNH